MKTSRLDQVAQEAPAPANATSFLRASPIPHAGTAQGLVTRAGTARSARAGAAPHRCEGLDRVARPEAAIPGDPAPHTSPSRGGPRHNLRPRAGPRPQSRSRAISTVLAPIAGWPAASYPARIVLQE